MRNTVIASAAAALLFISGGAALAGTTTTTWHFSTFTDTIPISCAGPGATAISATGNGVGHLTVNDTGSWFTTTFAGEGTITVTPPGGPSATYAGHVEEWFGDENNLQNDVQHATFNFNGTNVVTGASFGMHGAFDVTTNANGAITANHFNVNCR